MKYLNVVMEVSGGCDGMRSKHSGYLHPFCGAPMIEWALKAVAELGAERVVVAGASDELKQYLGDRTDYAENREEACGRFHEGTVLVMEGNVPGMTAELLAEGYRRHCEGNASVTELKSGEQTFAFFAEVSAKREDTTVFEVDDEAVMCVCDRICLAQAERAVYRRTATNLQLIGVTVTNPDAVFIAPDVTVGTDTVVLPGCHISGGTVIGEDCVIGPNTQLTGMTVGDRVTIRYTVGTDSVIGSDSTVGPFAYIRPNSRIGSNVKIGDFVEIKNSVIDTGTKVSHLTYVGDSDVGANVNFGCGTVTVNYDGVHKHRTTIGDGAFIGCNTNLVAPVTVAPETFIAAGSTITEDVPEDCLAIARSRQTNIQGWVSNRKEKKLK